MFGKGNRFLTPAFRRLQSGSLLLVLPVSLLFFACGTSQKMRLIRESELQAGISLPEGREVFVPNIKGEDIPRRDTLKVRNSDGTELLIMRAVKDDETGEMVATEQLAAAIVSARFRNIAERKGKVDISFDVNIPSDMQDSKWQLRLHPKVFVMQDTLDLDDVIVTGEEYRRTQIRGYQLYDRFLSKIILDSTLFIDKRLLETFTIRNTYPVSYPEIVEHYTNKLARSINDSRITKKSKMWGRFVKAPILTEGIRLDTIIRRTDGDFRYCYVQTIKTSPRMRKVDVVLSGEIYDQDRVLYKIPDCQPLTYYISSLSSFADRREKYITKIVERNISANTSCRIDFRQGRSDIDEDFGNNRFELSFVKNNIRSLMTNPTIEIDSILILASVSPEGSLKFNDNLSNRRAAQASSFFSGYVEQINDSLCREAGFIIDASAGEEKIVKVERDNKNIKFKSSKAGENWSMLDFLVDGDTLMTQSQKNEYWNLSSQKDLDKREKAMSRYPWYRHLKDDLYPRLRTVSFNFYMHRRGMLKDTVNTTVLDTCYMEGVQAIVDRDYEKAVSILRPYADYNTAVAYMNLDYNQSAFSILKNLPETPQINYMMAVLYSRCGDDEAAVQSYLNACRMEPSFVHRGNLDPEISVLISRYNLNLLNEK